MTRKSMSRIAKDQSTSTGHMDGVFQDMRIAQEVFERVNALVGPFIEGEFKKYEARLEVVLAEYRKEIDMYKAANAEIQVVFERALIALDEKIVSLENV